MHSYLPWQLSYWKVLQRRRREQKIPHALLFAGPLGIGKHQFAQAFAQSLLCLSLLEDDTACGECKNCQLIAACNHPDYLEISPDEKGKAIKIDQVRALIEITDKTAQVAHYQVILIEPADALNINAANALLKTLEEPSGNVLMILVTSRLTALPATIRSRCQILHFPTPNEEIACDWLNAQAIETDQLPLLLKLAHGAPLRVLQLLEANELDFRVTLFKKWLDFIRGKNDVVSVSQSWAKEDMRRILNHWMSWVMDLIYLKQDNKNSVNNHDIIDVLTEISLRCDLRKLHEFYSKLLEASRFLNSAINLNPQLMIEDLLIVNSKILTREATRVN